MAPMTCPRPRRLRPLRSWRSRPAPPALAALLLLAGCATAPAPAVEGDDYLRWVAIEVPGNEHVLVRWREERMPLRVHLPPPPAGLFPDPEAILDSVRDGVTDWAGVAAPGVPAFAFVDDPGAAHITIEWAGRPTGDWYVAHCAPDLDVIARRLDGAHILVTARRQDGRLADLHDVHGTMLHEVGHALGLLGHSPDPGDVTHAYGPAGPAVLSARDRATLRALYARPVGARVLRARQPRAVAY